MQPKTILLIEDDADTREVYTAILRRGGFRVRVAANGGEGVRLAREEVPDLVVTDLGMPAVDGWQATELLKQHASTAHLPVIAITANAQDFYRGRAEAAGCDLVLEKPCPPDVLLEAIHRLLPKV
jgi:two-component system, cell cycle response regulator DivK